MKVRGVVASTDAEEGHEGALPGVRGRAGMS